MKKVIRTKEISLKQVKNIIINLREKFKGSASIKIEYWAWYSDKNEVEYWFWVRNIFHETLKSWKEVQDAYFKLMEQ